MANDEFSDIKAYNWPSSSDVVADIRSVQITGTIGPGSLGYYESEGVVRASTSATDYAGVIGRKYDHDEDTAYTDQEYGVPFVLHKPGIVVPIKCEDPGAEKQIGTLFSLGATAGSATLSPALITGAAFIPKFKADETVGNGDTRMYGRMI